MKPITFFKKVFSAFFLMMLISVVGYATTSTHFLSSGTFTPTTSNNAENQNSSENELPPNQSIPQGPLNRTISDIFARSREVAREHQLYQAGSLHFNWGGMQEKWLKGKDNKWFYITPDGKVRRWNSSGSMKNDPIVGEVAEEGYHDFDWLYDHVLEVKEKYSLTYSSSNQSYNWGGYGEKWILGKDAQGKDQWYWMTADGKLRQWTSGGMQNNPVVAHLNPKIFQELTALQSEDELKKTYGFQKAAEHLRNWSGYLDEWWMKGKNNKYYFITKNGVIREYNGESRSNLMNAKIVGQLWHEDYLDPSWLLSRAERLVNNFHLFYGDNLHFNWLGLGEKWIKGVQTKWYESEWFYILPDGRVYRWDRGTSQTTDAFLGQLSTAHYQNLDSWLEYREPMEGIVESSTIYADSLTTWVPSNWNPHLPKIVTDGVWTYAVYMRFMDRYEDSYAWIFKRKNDGGQWQYTGQAFNNLRQPPGLAIDKEGRLHIIFSCMPGGSCAAGGISAPASHQRFYDLVFEDKNEDGSINFQRGVQYNEWPWPNGSYMGIGTNPVTGKTYASLLTGVTPPATQNIFEIGTNPNWYQEVPKLSGQNVSTLYPMFAFSPKGRQFLMVGELMAGSQNSLAYQGLSFFAMGEDGSLTPVLSLRVDQPNGVNRFIYGSDITFDENDKAHIVYHQQPPDKDGNCTFIVSEQSGGGFGQAVGGGCLDNYAQMQIDSKGRMHLVTTQMDNLFLRTSDDGGKTWKDRLLKVPNLRNPTGYLYRPTITKPWNSANAYDPDIMYGIVEGLNGSKYSWYVNDFRIDLSKL